MTNFRSVEDSGWIDIDEVTALIGTNESGKTNLLLPLWKLKPAKDGEINPIADFPRKRYTEIRNLKEKPVFIEAHFELSDELVNQLTALTGAPADDVRIAKVTRDLGGMYTVGFPQATMKREVEQATVLQLLGEASAEIAAVSVSKSEEALQERMRAALTEAQHIVEAAASSSLGKDVLQQVIERLAAVDTRNALKRSLIKPRYGQVSDTLAALLESVSKPHPQENEQARTLVKDNMPAFVYYSNYGNLDSEIYLPHVLANMQRTDLGSREEAKARTLRVLFEFVKLQPKEILELGQEVDTRQGRPTEDQIKVTAAKKTEREILLQSASSSLTEKFRNWWKQGDYRFRLQADGNHFRIWVSDDKRPEEIELEGRSTGLQWFLSFYLVFLVESAEAHKGAILLLDEPGLSLHPIAQRALSAFFENLSQKNQLIYTTHSPFLVDADHLDRVKVVYIDERGATVASANLRASESRPAESQSIYPVHAALGLSVSDILLQGCQPVIVEGPSDQLYLSALKTYLISSGRIHPKRELIFIPAGSAKGVGAAVAILTGVDHQLPYVILDSDGSGLRLATQLKSMSYQRAENRILLMGEICHLSHAEIEDLLPPTFLAAVVTRHLRGPEEDFSEVVVLGQPIVPQIEAYARKYSLPLQPGWKVDIAKKAKERLLKNPNPLAQEQDSIQTWVSLFEQLDQAAS